MRWRYANDRNPKTNELGSKRLQFAPCDGKTKSDRRTRNKGSREATGKVAGATFVNEKLWSFREYTMAKSIISIGFDIPGYDDQCLRLDSDQSLLDYDIIIFTPQISGTFPYNQTQFKGKPWLDESSSFNLKEKSERWRQELTSAFDHGKTIIIFLPPYEEVYVATGDHSYSGSGRNRVTTTHVEPFYNYGMIPLSFDELIPTLEGAVKVEEAKAN
jgi:hypothetical protein